MMSVEVGDGRRKSKSNFMKSTFKGSRHVLQLLRRRLSRESMYGRRRQSRLQSRSS